MKKSFIRGLFLIIIFPLSSSISQDESIEFICYKTHKATNTCHYNFIINGAKYRHVDMGCKFSKKKDDCIKKVKEGSLALAKDWKIDCPEPKEKNDAAF